VFDLLQHPPRSPERIPLGAGVSIAVHAALVLALLTGARQVITPAESNPESVIESTLRYLLPPDRPPSSANEPRATWSPAPAGTRPADPKVYSESVQPAGTPTPTAPPPAPPQTLAEAAAAQNAFTLLDVDSAATRDPTSAVPVYPRLLEQRGIEGMAVVRFVVDTTGRADLATFRVVETNHPLFAAAVRDALPQMKFHPASVGAKKVRQMVELPFGFQIIRREAAAAKRPQE